MIIDKIKALSKEDFITFIDDLINYDNPEYEWQSKIEPPLPFESFEDWLFREDEEIVSEIPPIENKGEWEKVSAERYVVSAKYRYRCSKCGGIVIGEFNFCPNCGADMRKTETCNGCTHPCVMYEPTMKACEKKGR